MLLFVTAAPDPFALLRNSKIEPRTGHQKVRMSNRRFLFIGVGRAKAGRPAKVSNRNARVPHAAGLILVLSVKM